MAEAKAWVMIPKVKNKGTECEIDMRPMVLCKDCKHCDTDTLEHCWCKILARSREPDWFCADGEMRVKWK